MNIPSDSTSFALGLGAGFVSFYVINTEAAERINQRICKLAKVIYNSLTFENVLEFTVTCIGVAFAASIAVPAIKDIFHTIMT